MFASLALGMDAPGYSISSSRGLGECSGDGFPSSSTTGLSNFFSKSPSISLIDFTFFKLLKSSRQFVY